VASLIKYASITVILALIGAPSVNAQINLLYEELRYDDTVVQCGALFKLVSAGYEDAGNEEKAKAYQSKFEKLLRQTTEEVSRAGRGEKFALRIYRERSDHLTRLIDKDIDFMKRHLVFCDRKFQYE
jgi:hypothetical protein